MSSAVRVVDEPEKRIGLSGSSAERHCLIIEADGSGNWLVNGNRLPAIEGSLDLDLEASLVTNMAPVPRLGWGPNAPNRSSLHSRVPRRGAALATKV